MKVGVDVLVEVRRTYILDAEDEDAAQDRVQALLDAGKYDDTDTERWTSSGAEVTSSFEMDAGTPVDPEFR